MPSAALKFVLPALALAGCTWTAEPPMPQAARLSAEVLTVTLSDGKVCRADWVNAGPLEPCGPGYRYQVNVVENPNLLRQLFTGVTAALGDEGAVPPMAEVVIDEPNGRRFVFVSPPPTEDD